VHEVSVAKIQTKQHPLLKKFLISFSFLVDCVVFTHLAVLRCNILQVIC